MRLLAVALVFGALHFQCMVAQEAKADTSGNFSVIGIPTIDYSRTLGAKLGAIGMGFFKINRLDTISPLSSVGAIGMWTTNKSWVAMVYTQLYFHENRYRIKAAGGLASFNYQFFEDQYIPGGIFINFNSSADFAYAQFAVRTWKQLFVGLHGMISKRQTVFDLPLPSDDESRWFNAIGLAFEWDTRSNVYNSKTGLYGTLTSFTFRDWLGSEVSFDNLDLAINKYFELNESSVLAARLFGYAALGSDVPFEAQRSIGRDDLRGYTQGEFRGEKMLAVQAEYRWTFHKRWGMVGFAGVAAAFDKEDWSGLLPGLGAGIRYMMLKDKQINVGFDAAVGIRDWGIYFRITEAF